MELNLIGKIALVGGSSKGLGRACALTLAREGVNIVLCARNEAPLLKTKKEIEALGVEVLALVADMGNKNDNARVVQEAVDRFGRIDIPVNNSGGPKPGTFRERAGSPFDAIQYLSFCCGKLRQDHQ